MTTGRDASRDAPELAEHGCQNHLTTLEEEKSGRFVEQIVSSTMTMSCTIAPQTQIRRIATALTQADAYDHHSRRRTFITEEREGHGKSADLLYRKKDGYDLTLPLEPEAVP